MYSLVSAAVMAQDLLRHPYAARLAEAVERVLALGPSELAALGGPGPEPVRRRVLETCLPPQRPSAGAPRTASPSPEATHADRKVDVLDGALLGTLDDLHRLLLREEPLRSAAQPASQVALDAVTVAWAGPAAALPDAAVLLAPWEDVVPAVGPPLERGGSVLRDLLDEVVRRSPAQWQRTAAAHVARRSSGISWGAAMHEACRAAWEHDRLHDVARAQLAAVRALALAPHASTAGAVHGTPPGAAAMAVTSAVQAVCTADLLRPATTAALIASWGAGR